MSILIAVVVVTLVTAVNDYTRDQQFRVLEAAKDNENVLLRRSRFHHHHPLLFCGELIGGKYPAD